MKIKKIINLSLMILFTCLLLNTTIRASWENTTETAGESLAEVKDESINTMYGIGSVSKVFTAAAVMKLVDEGKIDLDAFVTEYIPEFTMADERFRNITVRMLLNHSSGIMGSSLQNSILLGDNDAYAHDTLLDTLKQQKLKADPGEFSVYCNDGFTLAEIVVERVSGISFTQFLDENFIGPLQMSNTKTPLSNFDTNRLARNYYQSLMELPRENTNVIGSGGIYSSAVDLCKFAQVFMKDNDGILSENAIHAMESKETQNQIVAIEGDTVLEYGLGWDSVDTYPFNQYNIQALSKGGATVFYHSNLTVLPEYNLAAAVISSGGPAAEQLIVQEILLEVLKEEGLIDEIKDNNAYVVTEPEKIPEDMKEFAGIYEAFSMLKVEFSDTSLFLSTIGTKNDKTQEYIYMKDDSFISANGDYINLSGLVSAEGGTTGTAKITFEKGNNNESYLLLSSYENMSELGQTAYTMPFAQKVKKHYVSEAIGSVWEARTDKTYYLANAKYTCAAYLDAPIARTSLNKEIPGYVLPGIYEGPGFAIRDTKIVDENHTEFFQQIPGMIGRDLDHLSFYEQGGYEHFSVRGYSYVTEDSLRDISDIEDRITIGEDGDAKWFRIDKSGEGKKITIIPPENGSFFLYDDKFTCIATSLSLNQGNTVTLPVGGTVVFVAEPGGQFSITMN